MPELQLQLGTQGSITDVVREEHLASTLSLEPGEAYPAVLSTTRTIALCEVAAGRALRPILQDGELSVGVFVDVHHLAATLPGAAVTATATYQGRDGKLFVFAVTARDEGGEIMRGTHKRAVVAVERLLAGARKRRGW